VPKAGQKVDNSWTKGGQKWGDFGVKHQLAWRLLVRAFFVFMRVLEAGEDVKEGGTCKSSVLVM